MYSSTRDLIEDGTMPSSIIGFGPPTAESKYLKKYVKFDFDNLFLRSPALWCSQNAFGPLTIVAEVVDF